VQNLPKNQILPRGVFSPTTDLLEDSSRGKSGIENFRRLQTFKRIQKTSWDFTTEVIVVFP
jgi:hypothetical protein